VPLTFAQHPLSCTPVQKFKVRWFQVLEADGPLKTFQLFQQPALSPIEGFKSLPFDFASLRSRQAHRSSRLTERCNLAKTGVTLLDFPAL
jgi:hypothetical protein